MYNKHLDTFIAVADAGSFLKASEQLYISPNAVMKQINLLEGELNIKLFERSKHGLILTIAGELYSGPHVKTNLEEIIVNKYVQ